MTTTYRLEGNHRVRARSGVVDSDTAVGRADHIVDHLRHALERPVPRPEVNYCSTNVSPAFPDLLDHDNEFDLRTIGRPVVAMILVEAAGSAGGQLGDVGHWHAGVEGILRRKDKISERMFCTRVSRVILTPPTI
jgi:hypothetical protein